MKKKFSLFNPETLSFKEKTIEFPPDFITGFKERDAYYQEAGLRLIVKLKNILQENLPVQQKTFLKNCVAKEILPYLFCYQFEDKFVNYVERRDFYLALEKTNQDLHEILSYNKYRKRRIESVLNYAKHFAVTPGTIRIRSLVESHYDLDNPYAFQTESWDFKDKISESICELTNVLIQEILWDIRKKIAA